jgi:hypothetical protein
VTVVGRRDEVASFPGAEADDMEVKEKAAKLKAELEKRAQEGKRGRFSEAMKGEHSRAQWEQRLPSLEKSLEQAEKDGP